MTTTTHTDLHVCRLDEEASRRTCGNYRYVVTAGGQSHTAFRLRSHLDAWLALLGLSLERPLSDEGPGHCRVVGSYRTAMCLSEKEQAKFWTLKGTECRWVSNGEYTLGKVVADTDGIMAVWFLNPNVRDRPTFEYAQSRDLVG